MLFEPASTRAGRLNARRTRQRATGAATCAGRTVGSALTRHTALRRSQATQCQRQAAALPGAEQAQGVCPGGGLAAAADTQLAEDVGHVHAGRLG
jgi:hypothetical protein